MRSIYIFPLSIILLLLSCDNKEVVTERYKNGNAKKVNIYRGEKCIKEVMYHENKEKYVEINMNNNVREGEAVAWYPNGKLWSKGSYVNGKAHGKRTTWYENGKIRYEGYYNMGKETGEWKFYDTIGKLVKTIKY